MKSAAIVVSIDRQFAPLADKIQDPIQTIYQVEMQKSQLFKKQK